MLDFKELSKEDCEAADMHLEATEQLCDGDSYSLPGQRRGNADALVTVVRAQLARVSTTLKQPKCGLSAS